MVGKDRGIYVFLGTSRVLINMEPRKYSLVVSASVSGVPSCSACYFVLMVQYDAVKKDYTEKKKNTSGLLMIPQATKYRILLYRSTAFNSCVLLQMILMKCC